MDQRFEDGALIQAIQRKDVTALELFYERYRVLSYSLALRLLSDPRDAEDVVQEVFVNVWKSASSYRSGASSPRSWLLSIVRNRAIDKLRGRAVRPSTVDLDGGMNLPDSNDVWKDVADSLTADVVRKALDQLPPEQRQAIQMAYFDGFTQSQIAEQLSLPLGTVKGRLRIALHKLKDLLEAHQTESVWP